VEEEEIPQEGEEITRGRIPAETARWLFDYSLVMKQIEASLSGGELVVDPKYGTVKIQNPSYTLLSKEAVKELMGSCIRPFVIGNIQGASNIDLERLDKWCFLLKMAVAKFLAENWVRYNLTKGKASMIVNMVVNIFEANLSKSLGGKSLDLVAGTERVSIIKSEPKKKRWWPL